MGENMSTTTYHNNSNININNKMNTYKQEKSKIIIKLIKKK